MNRTHRLLLVSLSLFVLSLVVFAARSAFADGIPDPVAQPVETLSLFQSLYHSGAYACMVIVAAFVGLTYAEDHVAWFAVGARKHWCSALLGGIAIIALPASHGTTPNASMISIAIGTVVSLMLPGRGAALESKSAQAGFAHVLLMPIVAAVTAIALLVSSGCGAKTKAAEQSFATCTKDAAEQSLEPTVIAIFTSGVPNWKQQLIALATAFGPQEIDCVAQFAKDLMKSKVGGPVDQAALARIDEWLAGHGK